MSVHWCFSAWGCNCRHFQPMKIHSLEFSTPTIVFPYSERSCFFTTMSTVTACTQVNLKLLIMFSYSALLLKAAGPCTHIYIPGFWQREPRFSSVFLRDTFTWHAAAEKHTGFCISHSPEGRKQQRLSNCCCLPSGFDFTFRPPSNPAIWSRLLW